MRGLGGWVFLLVAAWCVAGSCRTESPQLRLLPAEGVVLAFGDSLTRGTGAGEGESYPERLGELIGRRVINAGVPGELTAEGLRRLPKVLAEHRPHLVILCHGGNDLLRGLDRGRTADNLSAMVRTAREAGADVVLLGVPSPGVFLRPPGFFQEVASEASIPFDGEILQRILGNGALKADPIHPNGEGYQQLAEAVRDLLIRSGAIL